MPVLVGDHHYGLVKVLVEFPDQFQDRGRVPGIEIGAGLIAQVRIQVQFVEDGVPVHFVQGQRGVYGDGFWLVGIGRSCLL